MLGAKAERVADGFLGEVVHRRAQAPGRDETVGTTQRLGDGERDPLAVVPDRSRTVNVDAGLREMTGYVRRIGVHQLPQQQFGSNGQEFDARHPPAPPRSRPAAGRIR